MSVAIENNTYYLVAHGREDDAIFVFFGHDPSGHGDCNQSVAAVTLELLPARQRFGGAGGVAMGLPVLGRWPGGMNRFRQFLTVTEMNQAGWTPVPRYRICDYWEDFFSPWSFLEEDQATPAGLQPGSNDDTGTISR